MCVRSLRICKIPLILTTELYATKPAMMVHHPDLECNARRLGSYLQGQGDNMGSNPQKITMPYLNYEVLNLLQPNLV